MIYVLSDVHGNERRFDSILRQINLHNEDTLYVLGDVIDRHPGGIRILRRIMAMPNAKMILGNHEYMMLRALGHPCDDNYDDGRALEHWYRNGGKVTHDHWKRIRKALRKEIIDYLLRLPLNMNVHVAGKWYQLVHGAMPEGYMPKMVYKNPTHYAVWKRLDESDIADEGYTLVFGHTPTEHYQPCVPMEIWRGKNAIGIDCGSGYPEHQGRGRLACLRLDDGKVFYSEETTEIRK